jgi:formylglycine-generating enzyme required for sulfatase activity
LNRYNYKTSDNTNYKDGDLSSTLGPDWLEDDNLNGSQRMYNYQGNDSTSNTHDGATSLITNEVRVFKGGGWDDRAYWLIPGTRRFLDQNRSTNDIGFRCAMIRVGAPSGIK